MANFKTLYSFVFLVLVQGLYSYQIVSAVDDHEPSYDEYAKMARYIVHKVDWTAMGTISTEKTLLGYPMVNVISMADSAKDEKSTGNIYFLLTDLDFTGQDLGVQNKLTAFFSMEQYKNCSDPMEPTCGRVMISGQMIKLTEGSEEYVFGNRSMMSRHPNAANWIKTHSFYLCKLDIVEVIVLDFYGGPHYVTREDYYQADPDKLSRTQFTDNNNNVM